ncbi:hypothetical protein EC991_010373 [Linnemannia zychae]|nr:hypothetical protein EC991_010373 [Linnemannia zychae]
MNAKPVSAPPSRSYRASKSTTLLTLRSAILIVTSALISSTATATGAFELQTNLVSCGGDSSNNAAAAPAAGSVPVAVCSPPESKLFNNVRVVNGTPQPGSTGVRGRLYDVGTLCTEKVADKIDRAWIAFLDCGGGCPLSTKLANLQGSNPQAVLIYNQAACTVDSSAAPANGSAMPAAPNASPMPVAPGASPVPAAPTAATPAGPAAPVATSPAAAPAQPPPAAATTTGDAAAPAPAAPTQPVDSKPNGDDEGGDSGEGGDSNDDGDSQDNDDGDNTNDDGEGGGDDDDDDGDSNDRDDDDDNNEGDDDDNEGGDDDDNGEDGLARKHPRSFRGSRSNIISLEALVGGSEEQTSQELLPQGRSPRPRPVPHPHGGAGVVVKARSIKMRSIKPKGRSPRPRPVPHPHGGLVGGDITIEGRFEGLTEPQGRSPRPRPVPRPHGGPAVIAAAASGLSLEPEGRSPRPRPVPRPHIGLVRRRAIASDSKSHPQQQDQSIKVMDIADTYVQFPITVAIPEQVTTDYLLKILTGPAAFSPLPAPLKALKTTVNPNGATVDSTNPTAAADANAGVITDLMVSISPAFGESTGERKFLSMSKPIFATVIGVLSAVVCGVVLMYVVRPLVKRQRRHSGRGGSVANGIGGGGSGGSTVLVDDESSSDSPRSTAGGDGYYGNSTTYSNNNGSKHFESGYKDYNQYSSKESVTTPTSAKAIIAPYSAQPPMQEVYSEKYTQQQQNDNNSAPTIFDHSPSSNNNSAYPTTPSSARAYVSTSATAAVAASLNAGEHDDPEYAKKHLELLRRQDLPELPASTVATPTTSTFAPSTTATPTTTVAPISIQKKDTQSVRTRPAWGGYTPTTPTGANAYSLSTPTSTTATVATATPTTASVEPLGSTSSVYDAFRASNVGHNRVNSNVVDMTIPEESQHELLEPTAPQDYSSLTPATSGLLSNRNENADDDEDDRYSVVSSRNGSDLFHSESKPRLFPSSIDTSSTAKEGGIATALYRNHRLSMDGAGPTTTFSPASQSPLAGLYPRGNSGLESNSSTPRVSISKDYMPSRLSMDSTSYRDRDLNRSSDLQTRFQELMSSSRAPTSTSTPNSAAPRSSIDSNGTPRASFSDDYRPRIPTSMSSSRLASSTNGEATPRASISNDFLTSRTSMDSQRSATNNTGNIQTRFQEIASSSRGRLEGNGPSSAASLTGSTPRASFSEDFPSRPSLDALRANMNASTPTSATMSASGSELLSPLREQRASTANWSRYSRRDPPSGAGN